MGTWKPDAHCAAILDEFDRDYAIFERIRSVAGDIIDRSIKENGLYITALETRVKARESLAGKLELKGHNYRSLSDITDIVGARVITFYSDEVDKIAALVENTFDIDWENSVDKRRMHELDSFGYNSLHYICRIPESLFCDPEMPQINRYRFEVQMRTALQHVWATMHHDTGYKSGIEIPREYLRSLSRLAGLLELADEQFSQIRSDINNYRRRIETLVASGHLNDVPLNGDTYRSYMESGPLDSLNRKIASINQAEIVQSSPMPYLDVLITLKIGTIGELDRIIAECSEDAYRLSAHQIATTDLDIISSMLSLQNILTVLILRKGLGAAGLKLLFDIVDGNQSQYNADRAERITEIARHINIIR